MSEQNSEVSRWLTVHTVTAVHPDQEPVSLMDSTPEVTAEAAMADLAEESSAGSVQFPEVVGWFPLVLYCSAPESAIAAHIRWPHIWWPRIHIARQYIHWFVGEGQLLPLG